MDRLGVEFIKLRKIVQYPTDRYEGDSRDPRVVEKLIDYDADGNQTTIKKKTADPEDPVAEKTETLRRYRWDEEDRLRAVDLAPENEENRPEVATYTYDADGQRSIKYVPEGLEAHYSAKDAGRKQHLATMLYPSPLLTVEALDLPTQEELPSDERTLQDLNNYHLTRYTKHYFIGSERLNSTIGSLKNLGVLCEPIYGTISREIVMEMNNKVENAGQALKSDYAAFDKTTDLGDPYFYSDNEYLTFCGEALPNRYAAYWFHPDHLGSSNYITDLNGNISQHLEYFPFGETLVEEHKNSNNSPYKFNAKELDDETGNYYYGARYLNPKFSIWLSVDPLAEKYPGWSPYNYTMQNPINATDPDGRSVDWKPKLNNDGSTTYIREAGDNEATLKSQYDLSDETASVLYSSMDKSGEISGQSVYNTTGSEVLKLDLNSKQATNQRKFDQYVYGRDRTASLGSSNEIIYAFLATDYYSNTDFKNVLRGYANMNINGENIKLHFNIPVYNSVSSSSDIGIGVEPVRIKSNGLGSYFGDNQNAVRSPIYHPKTGNQMRHFDIYAKGNDADKIYHRLSKTFPTYNYFNPKPYKE